MAERRSHEPERVRVYGRERGRGGATARVGEERLDLERRAPVERQTTHRGHAPLRNGERLREARLGGRREEARLQGAEAFELPQVVHEALERLDPVAQTCGVLVAKGARERCEPGAGTRERPRLLSAFSTMPSSEAMP